MSTVRLLLVAQSPVLRFGIRGTLEQVLPLDEVIEATGALEAAPIHERVRPDLTVIHDALPGVNANVTAKMLQELRPGSTILILSDHAGDGHAAAAEQHGATALISLAEAPAAFAAAVRNLLQRNAVRGTDRLISTARVAGLTAAEIATLDGLVRGIAVNRIAASLRIGDAGVERSIAALIEKLGAGDLPSAVVAAVRLGLANLTDQLPTPHNPLETGIASAA